MTKIELGDYVQDTITGFKGTAIGRTSWITGCDRITVQPKGLNKEGKTYDTQTFDEGTLDVITPTKKKKEKTDKGGPMPQVSKY